MREDPGLNEEKIAICLETNYGVRAMAIEYLPIGYDLFAFVYKVTSSDNTCYFLKIRSNQLIETSLLVPRALLDLGVRNVLAPLLTCSSELWCSLDGYPGYTLVLYPFIHGVNAKAVGLSDDQWREFGSTLRAVHDSGLAERFRHQLRVETFDLPSAALVRSISSLTEGGPFESPAAASLAVFWRSHRERIDRMLDRAESLGHSLQSKSFEHVLCHSDIHLANILLGDDGNIYLIDWDSPLIAPRERDMIFVVETRIARTVTPREEDLFFDGYGPIDIDRDAFIYYRYERIVEDIGEMAKATFLNDRLSEEARAGEARNAMSFMAPDGDIERAETVHRLRWPSAS